MANGATVISGAFSLDTEGRAAIDNFITTTATMSGAQIVVFPEINTAKLWIGVTETGSF